MVVAWNLGLGHDRLPVMTSIMSWSCDTGGFLAAMAPRPIDWMVWRLPSLTLLQIATARTWLGLGLGVGTRVARIRGKSPKKSNSRVSRSRWPPAIVLPTTDPAEVPTMTSGISYGTPLAWSPWAKPSIQAAKYSPPPPSARARSL